VNRRWPRAAAKASRLRLVVLDGLVGVVVAGVVVAAVGPASAT
jgi:hypothetical protein